MSLRLDKGDTSLIIQYCFVNGLLRNQAAYVLATAFHESAGTMKPVRETLALSDAQAIARLERAWDAGKLRWVRAPYWRDNFFGRGYVQLTHKANYEKAGKEIGADLAGNPALAMVPANAAAVLVVGMRDGWFTTKRLAEYVTLKSSDFVGARRTVNGTDQAEKIAGHAKEYDVLLKESGYGSEADDKDDEEPVKAPVAPVVPVVPEVPVAPPVVTVAPPAAPVAPSAVPPAEDTTANLRIILRYLSGLFVAGGATGSSTVSDAVITMSAGNLLIWLAIGGVVLGVGAEAWYAQSKRAK